MLLRYANELQLLPYVRSRAFFCYISQNLKDIEISQNRVAEEDFRMNRGLKKQIAKAFDAPAPRDKAQFVRSLPRPHISTKAFIFSQSLSLKKVYGCCPY